MTIQLRAAQAADAGPCGRIIYDAFQHIAGGHGFPADFPTRDSAQGLAQHLIADPSVFGVVAERDGEVIGSNFLMEGGEVHGVGPITVDPAVQGSGIGRRLMQAVLERSRDAAGIRLLQDAFNMRSIALYASLGFEVREPLLVMTGTPRAEPDAGIVVRSMLEADLDACDSLCREIHGISRRGELVQALGGTAPFVAERAGRITAYMTAPHIWLVNHGVAESDADMQALITGAGRAALPVSFLLPTRQADLFRWCLGQGMQAVKPMTLMTLGRYTDPDRPYMPSVFY